MEAMLMARKRGSAKPYAGLPHPTPLVDAAKEWTTSLDAWQLVALSSMASQCKSWLIAYALLDTCAESSTKSSNGPQRPFRDMAEAIEASRVEEEFQISIWGMVEGQHDYDRLNASIQILSSQLFFKSILLDNTRY
jgi:chaperone required for assembly of F1-ATPase